MLRGPKYKICRRLGSNVFEKCQTQSYQLREQKRKPARRRRGPSDYGLELLEKQRVRFTYGLKESQFSRYVKEASEKQGAVPADTLYQTLERRLDNVVYRLGFAPTRAFARQLISHGHIHVGGRKLDIPSHLVKVGDTITIKDSTKKKNVFDIIKEHAGETNPPNWLSRDLKTFTGTVKKLPQPEQSDVQFNLTSVIQFYSR